MPLQGGSRVTSSKKATSIEYLKDKYRLKEQLYKVKTNHNQIIICRQLKALK